MRRELPVTTEPWVKTYSYYALPMCAIMADERIGKQVAEFEILDSDGDDWTSIHMRRGAGNNWCYVSEDDYNRDCNGCVYRPLEHNKGYIRIKIGFQQYSEPWAAINLFVTDEEENILLGDEQYLCRFGNFVYDGVSLYFSGERTNIARRALGYKDELVLSVSDGKIEAFVGEKCPKKIGEKEIVSKRPLYIGVQVRHEDNSFYPWFFSNFIQINCDVNCTHRRLDYYSFYKDEEYDLVSYFLDRNRFEAGELPPGRGIWSLKKAISKGNYVELKIDQYYLFGHEEYHLQHHLHQNLIYGYDDRLHAFLTIGYSNSGKIRKYRIRYTELKSSLKRYPEVRIKIMTYRQGIHFYRFIPSYVKGAFEDYLAGLNSERKMQAFLPSEERICGLGVYEELKTDTGLDVLVSDRRVSYLLYEHKQIMEKRISYMRHMGIISKNLFEKVEDQMQTLVKLSFNLINVAQKYRMRPSRRSDEKLVTMLDEIMKNEKELLMRLLEEGDW